MECSASGASGLASRGRRRACRHGLVWADRLGGIRSPVVGCRPPVQVRPRSLGVALVKGFILVASSRCGVGRQDHDGRARLPRIGGLQIAPPGTATSRPHHGAATVAGLACIHLERQGILSRSQRSA